MFAVKACPRCRRGDLYLDRFGEIACVQCGQCVDACEHTQETNPSGTLLEWVNEVRAESEAAFNVGAARTIMLKRVPADSPDKPAANTQHTE